MEQNVADALSRLYRLEQLVRAWEAKKLLQLKLLDDRGKQSSELSAEYRPVFLAERVLGGE